MKCDVCGISSNENCTVMHDVFTSPRDHHMDMHDLHHCEKHRQEAESKGVIIISSYNCEGDSAGAMNDIAAFGRLS